MNKLPHSSSNLALNAICCAVFIITIIVLTRYISPISDWAMCLILFLCMMPLFIRELIVARDSLGVLYRRKQNFERLQVKLIGLYATYGLIVFLYWIFPVYSFPFYSRV